MDGLSKPLARAHRPDASSKNRPKHKRQRMLLTGQDYLTKLPDELLLEIAVRCLPEDLAALACSAKHLGGIADQVLYQGNDKHENGSAMLWAVRLDRLDTLKKALQHGFDINRGYNVKCPQFHAGSRRRQAARLGRDHIVKNCTALHFACALGQDHIVEYLLDNGCDASIAAFGHCICRCGHRRDDGTNRKSWIMTARTKYTPLHTSICNGNVSAALLLLEKQQGRYMSGTRGPEPIHIAAYSGLFPIVQFLVQVDGVDINKADPAESLTPVAHALRTTTGIAIISNLMALGADPGRRCDNKSAFAMAIDDGKYDAFKMMLEFSSFPISQEDLNSSLLALCHHIGRYRRPGTEAPHPSLVSDILRHGADVDVRGTYGETPLMALLGRVRDPDSTDNGLLLTAVQQLLEAGADVNAVGNGTRDDGVMSDTQFAARTPLMIAVCASPDITIPRLLLEHGADIAYKDNGGVDVLMAVCRQIHVSERKKGEQMVPIIRLLVSSGADPRRQLSTGATALHFACYYCHGFDSASTSGLTLGELLRAGADPNALMNPDPNPGATLAGRVEGVARLQREIRLFEREDFPQSTVDQIDEPLSPMDIALFHGDVAAAECLLQYGGRLPSKRRARFWTIGSLNFTTVEHSGWRDKFRVIKFMVFTYGVDVRTQTDLVWRCLANGNHKEARELLVDPRVTVNVEMTDKNGVSLLDLAARSWCGDIATLLGERSSNSLQLC